jgi:DNA-binding Xre family transcriptional regulator
MTTRRLDFRWNLRQMMAGHHLWKATQLASLLRERGVDLSDSQVRRLVTHKPQRLSMEVLVALCDLFGCTPSDLIMPYVVSGVGLGEGQAGDDVDGAGVDGVLR